MRPAGVTALLTVVLLTGVACSSEPSTPAPALGPTQTVTAPMSYPRVLPTDAITVTAFGARPDDDADDTTAIQAAFDAIPASGGAVFIPAGRYRLSRTVTAHRSTTVLGIRGLDGSGSRLEVDPTVRVGMILDGDALVLDSVEVDAAIASKAADSPIEPVAGQVGVRVNGWFSQVRNSRILGFDTNLVLAAGFYSVIDSSLRAFGSSAITVDIAAARGDAGDGTISGNTLERNLLRRPGGSAITWLAGGGMRLVNNKINGERTLADGVSMIPRRGVKTGVMVLSDNSIENFTDAGIRIRDDVDGITNGLVIANNQIAGRNEPLRTTGIVVDSGVDGLAITGNSVMYTHDGIVIDDVRSATVAGNVITNVADTGIRVGARSGHVAIPQQTIDAGRTPVQR